MQCTKIWLTNQNKNCPFWHFGASQIVVNNSVQWLLTHFAVKLRYWTAKQKLKLLTKVTQPTKTFKNSDLGLVKYMVQLICIPFISLSSTIEKPYLESIEMTSLQQAPSWIYNKERNVKICILMSNFPIV